MESKLDIIKEEIRLCGEGLKYLDNLPIKYAGNDEYIEKATTEFLPKLSEKMKNLCQLVSDLEKETGRKFNWNNPDLIYDLGEQLDFTKELMKK